MSSFAQATAPWHEDHNEEDRDGGVRATLSRPLASVYVCASVLINYRSWRATEEDADPARISPKERQDSNSRWRSCSFIVIIVCAHWAQCPDYRFECSGR